MPSGVLAERSGAVASGPLESGAGHVGVPVSFLHTTRPRRLVVHFRPDITLVEVWAADEWHANLVPARAEQRCASALSERPALPLDDVRVPDSTRAARIAGC